MALLQDLPEWLEQGTEPSLRDTEDDNQPPGFALVTAPRSIASTSRGPAPIVLTPTGGHSPAVAGNSPARWTDLDQFYADVDEAAGSENGGVDETEGSDEGGLSTASESEVEGVSGEEETGSESEGSVVGRQTPGGTIQGLTHLNLDQSDRGTACIPTVSIDAGA